LVPTPIGLIAVGSREVHNRGIDPTAQFDYGALPMFASLSRRRFLTLSAAATAGATWFDADHVLNAARLADAKDAWGGFPVGVQSYSLRNYKLPEAIRHLQGMGVHYVELAGTHLPTTAGDEEIAETLKLCQAADLKVSAHGVNPFSKDHEKNKKIFDFCKKLGIRTISANPQPDAETFASLDKLVAEFDMRIAIHNHGPGALYDKLDSVTTIIKNHDKRIGACVDCGHFIASGEDPVKCVLALNDRVYGVHMKDHEESGKKSPSVVLGKGHLDVVGLFKSLRQIQFSADKALSLEYEANPMNPIDDMKACLEIAKEAIAKSA
jgi:inosose dehydratase